MINPETEFHFLLDIGIHPENFFMEDGRSRIDLMGQLKVVANAWSNHKKLHEGHYKHKKWPWSHTPVLLPPRLNSSKLKYM